MDNEIHTGKNRTGMKTSPVHSRELLEVREMTVPPNPERDAVAIRAEYLAEAEPVGSMPPPPTLRGMAGTAVKALTGKKMHVLLDKMGERAAYERTGTRLYDMMLQKVAAAPELPPGMTMEGVLEIRNEEHAHFQLLATAIEGLGADPTVMTPCADVTGVQGMGLVQAMGEPRLTMAQALSMMLALTNRSLEKNAGSTWWMVNTAVRSSLHSIAASMAAQVTLSSFCALSAVPRSDSARNQTPESAELTTRARSSEYSTSRQVMMLPLWNGTFSRSWNV